MTDESGPFLCLALSAIHVEPTDDVVTSLQDAISDELPLPTRTRLELLLADYKQLVLGGDVLDRVMANLSHFGPDTHVTNLIRETLVERFA